MVVCIIQNYKGAHVSAFYHQGLRSLHHSNSVCIALRIHSMLEICFNGAGWIFAPSVHVQMSFAGGNPFLSILSKL